MSKFDKIFFGILFWIWELTWGALLTYPGLLITAFCIIFLKGKVHKNGFSYIVEIGGDWGGLEIGACALCGSYSQANKSCYNPGWYEHTRKHEFGHNLQQLILGPFQLFIVGLPSVARYWYYEIGKKHGKTFSDDWYDSIWFEGTATRWGTKVIDKLEDKSNNESIILNFLEEFGNKSVKAVTPEKETKDEDVVKATTYVKKDIDSTTEIKPIITANIVDSSGDLPDSTN